MSPFSLIDRSRPVLVALSGGADSVALLHMLHTAGYHTLAAHCNFHLRGTESDADEAFARDYCRALGVDIVVRHFDTAAYADRHALSVEMAARELRYDWFAQLLDEHQIPLVAVAHHADDNAETLLLNLTRGTGLRGLTGMSPLNGRIVRPLLHMSRADIETYCQLNALRYVTDSSNLADDIARNRIRHHVIPELKAINPGFLRTMTDNMRHIRSVYDLFVGQVADWARQHVTYAAGETRLSTPDLASLPDPEPYIFELLRPRGFSGTAIHNLADALQRGHFGTTFSSDTCEALLDRTYIIVSSHAAEPDPVQLTIERDHLPWPAKPDPTDDEPTPTLTLIDAPDKHSTDPRRLHIDADRLQWPLTLRHWRPGDTFQPIGMNGSKKLSDFFIDNKLSIPEKNRVWLLADAAGRLAAAIPIRPAEWCKMTHDTTHALQIDYHGNQ